MNNNNKPQIIILCGSTGSGKSEIALGLCKKHLSGVIINADAMQTYKNIPILTAQPSTIEQKTIPHKLYGFLKADKKYSVFTWLEDAIKEINLAFKNNLTPILVGGTGMYINSLINGIRDTPHIPIDIIEFTNIQLQDKGLNFLYEQLVNADQNTKKYIYPQDQHRIIRAYHLYKAFAITPTKYRNLPNKKLFPHEIFKIFCLLPKREISYKNCDDRVLKMIKKGALNEIANLVKENYDDTYPIAKILGYKELYNYLQPSNTISIEKTIKKIQQITRNYVKRQNSWFKNQLNNNAIIEDNAIDLMNKIKLNL